MILINASLTSCYSDKEAVESFNKCLTVSQLETYQELVMTCDQFLELNYPDKDPKVRYNSFLKDLDSQVELNWLIDSISIKTMSDKLTKTFGDDYDTEEANFSVISNLTSCLGMASNKKWINEFIETKNAAGSIGPNLVGGWFIDNKFDPMSGLYKTIFITEVLWRHMYFQTIKD